MLIRLMLKPIDISHVYFMSAFGFCVVASEIELVLFGFQRKAACKKAETNGEYGCVATTVAICCVVALLKFNIVTQKNAPIQKEPWHPNPNDYCLNSFALSPLSSFFFCF